VGRGPGADALVLLTTGTVGAVVTDTVDACRATSDTSSNFRWRILMTASRSDIFARKCSNLAQTVVIITSISLVTFQSSCSTALTNIPPPQGQSSLPDPLNTGINSDVESRQLSETLLFSEPKSPGT